MSNIPYKFHKVADIAQVADSEKVAGAIFFDDATETIHIYGAGGVPKIYGSRKWTWVGLNYSTFVKDVGVGDVIIWSDSEHQLVARKDVSLANTTKVMLMADNGFNTLTFTTSNGGNTWSLTSSILEDFSDFIPNSEASVTPTANSIVKRDGDGDIRVHGIVDDTGNMYALPYSSEEVKDNADAILQMKITDLEEIREGASAGSISLPATLDYSEYTFTEKVTLEVKNDSATIRSIKGNSVVNADEIINGNYKAILSRGFNQWDEQWRNGIYDSSTGKYSQNTVAICNTNPIRVIAGLTYRVNRNNNIYAFFYDDNMNFISYSNMRATNTVVPNGAMYMNFYVEGVYGTTYKNDICINISDDSKNGTYEPYVEYNYDLSWIKRYFPEGMRSAGSVRDEIRFNSTTQKWEAIQRVGSDNLALTEVVVTEIATPDISYKAFEGGTEVLLTDSSTTPITAEIAYNYDAISNIESLKNAKADTEGVYPHMSVGLYTSRSMLQGKKSTGNVNTGGGITASPTIFHYLYDVRDFPKNTEIHISVQANSQYSSLWSLWEEPYDPSIGFTTFVAKGPLCSESQQAIIKLADYPEAQYLYVIIGSEDKVTEVYYEVNDNIYEAFKNKADKANGTSAQFVKGDGSLDNNSYADVYALTARTGSLSIEQFSKLMASKVVRITADASEDGNSNLEIQAVNKVYNDSTAVMSSIYYNGSQFKMAIINFTKSGTTWSYTTTLQNLGIAPAVAEV